MAGFGEGCGWPSAQGSVSGTLRLNNWPYDLGKNRAVGQPNVAIRVLSRIRRTQTTLARHRGIAWITPPGPRNPEDVEDSEGSQLPPSGYQAGKVSSESAV
jgi:hypothetical protein